MQSHQSSLTMMKNLQVAKKEEGLWLKSISLSISEKSLNLFLPMRWSYLSKLNLDSPSPRVPNSDNTTLGKKTASLSFRITS